LGQGEIDNFVVLMIDAQTACHVRVARIQVYRPVECRLAVSSARD
jgi:hypothetical protein